MSPALHSPTGGANSPRPPASAGPISRVFVALAVIAMLVLALIVAIPLLLIIVSAGLIAIAVTRWRLRRRFRQEMSAGRKNVRVIRRDA